MADVPPDRDDGQPAGPAGQEAPREGEQGGAAVAGPSGPETPATEAYAAWTPSSPLGPTSPGATPRSGDPVAPAGDTGTQRAESQQVHTPPWGSAPWGGAPWGTPPWHHDQPPWGPPPPWAAWYMWGPGTWQGTPGSTWQTPQVPPATPASRRRLPVPWAIAGAAAAVLALVAVGVGIGYGVWGTQAPAVARTASGAPPGRNVPFKPSAGGTRHAFLGVELAPGGFATATPSAPSTPSRGALVQKVVPGSPAARAGIVAGDTITSFGTQPVATDLALAFDVQHDVPGQRVKVDWTTSTGKHDSATVRLGSRPGGRAIG